MFFKVDLKNDSLRKLNIINAIYILGVKLFARIGRKFFLLGSYKNYHRFQKLGGFLLKQSYDLRQEIYYRNFKKNLCQPEKNFDQIINYIKYIIHLNYHN